MVGWLAVQIQKLNITKQKKKKKKNKIKTVRPFIWSYPLNQINNRFCCNNLLKISYRFAALKTHTQS